VTVRLTNDLITDK